MKLCECLTNVCLFCFCFTLKDNVMFVAYPVSTGYEYGQPQAYAEKTTNVI